jgi:hypothetical protein
MPADHKTCCSRLPYCTVQCCDILSLTTAESGEEALRKLAPKVFAVCRAMLFVLWSLLTILQPVNAGEVTGCSLAGNISGLADLTPTRSLLCPDGLELQYPPLGTGSLN